MYLAIAMGSYEKITESVDIHALTQSSNTCCVPIKS